MKELDLDLHMYGNGNNEIRQKIDLSRKTLNI